MTARDALVRDLLPLARFDEAAARVLDAVEGVARAGLDGCGDEPGWGGALLYVRGEAGARPGIVARGAGTPSMSTWQRVRAARSALVIDVLGGGRASRADGSRASELDGLGSERWKGTTVTHVLAWPLRAPGLGVCGMVSLELGSALNEAELRPFLPPLMAEVQLLLDAATAGLLLLPAPGAPEVAGVDTGFPVAGPEILSILEDLRHYLRLDDVILLRGETGTGKTRLARWCHERSSRARGPFQTLRLHEGPESLDGSALFGYVRGAFTGAVADRPGQIEAAAGGTLFIDEIDKLSREAQARLLGLLDEGRFCRLGDTRERRADVRVLVGTNANLEEEVRQGRFLRDLYYRVCVLPVTLPPLRERRSEIVPWAEHFLAEKAGELGLVARLTVDAEERLVRHPWPGNLRELENVVARAVAFARPVGSALTLGGAQVERALAVGGAATGLLERLERAAEAFVDEAERREEGRRLTIQDAEALRGFVVRCAVARHGAREAWRLLGQERALEQGNHQKLIRLHVKRAEDLEAVLREG